MPSRGDRQDNDKVEYEQLWPPISYNIPISPLLSSSRKHMRQQAISPARHSFAAGGRIQMPPLLAKSPAPFARAALKLWAAATAVWETMLAEQTKPYEPERYYMRGPGPKWREKHASRGGSAVQ
jgi:hypothetical protein